MTVAVFNYGAWVARYPEFAHTVDATLAAEYFAEAGLYLDNTDVSVVPADAVTYQPRLMLLGMLTAHIAALNAPKNGREGLVGRISSATQGSVSVATDNGAQPGTAAWFQQTQYGASYWTATARYRTFRQVRPCPAAYPWRS